jgi:hypothetical protein
MVRALASAPRAAKGRRTVLLPGATEAEPWELWTTGADAQCLGTCASPGENSDRRRDTVLALPVGQVVALPLWLQETDPKQFRGMIELQLEAHGLQPRGREAVFDSSIVAQEEARTLVLVAVLAPLLPEELETEACPTFELSARCFALPPDALVLWTEQDRLVLAITRGTQLAYFQTLSEPRLTDRAAQDLTCVVAALQMQGIIGPLKQAVAWTELTPAEQTALQSTAGLPVRQEARPAPDLPRTAWNLTPTRVDEVMRQRVTRRRQVGAAVLLVVLVLAAAAAMGLRLFLIQRDVSRLQQWQASHAGSLQAVQDTRAAWQDLQPVVDTQAYPLEVLLHVSESLPAEQVHLTLFEEEGGHLLIKAEAKNLTAAFQFFDQVKKNPHLSAYTFDMAQPHSLANDITQFQIEGTHATHD